MWTRRRVLQAAAASVTLPWMSSLVAADEGRAAALLAPPKRWGLFLFANGVNTDHWSVNQQGGALNLSKSLQPLNPHTKKLLFIDNLHLFDDTVGVHTPYFTNFLTGKELKPGSSPFLAPSIDQVLARSIGAQSPIPSLVLGMEPADSGLAAGSPAIYGSTTSWSSPTTPIAPTFHPRQVFDRLFDKKGLARDRSVLDFVLDQSKAVRGTLSVMDQRKLDEYTESVREIEKRIDRSTAPVDANAPGWKPSLKEPNLGRPEETLGAYPERVKLMLDLIVLAYQMDRTRLVTFLFQKDISSMTFDFIDGVSRTGHHTISHHNHKADLLADYQKINQWTVEQFAYLLAKMDAIDEGGSTLLDNSMLLFGSSIRDGDVHDANNLPLILAGKGGGTLSPGRHLTFSKLEDRRLCNLHLALMKRMGSSDDSFGNSHYELPGLSA